MTELPLGILVLGGFAAFGAWIAMTLRFELARLLIAFMLFTSATGIKTTATGRIINVGWLTPFQLARSEIFLACGILLGLALLTNLPKVLDARLSTASWYLIAIGVLQSVMRVFHEGPVGGAMSMFFAAATLVTLAYAIAALTRTREDAIAMIRVIAFANMAYIACCFVSLVVSPDSIVMTVERRFNGLAAQPITAAITLGVGCVAAIWLVLYDPKWRYRWLWIALIGTNAVLVLATGSRTGILILAIGGAAVLYRRLGRIVILAPVGVVSILLTMVVLDKVIGLNFAFDRATTIEDTRTDVWRQLIVEGMSSPLIGIGTGAHVQGGTSQSENSYLYGFAAFGVSMLLLLVTFLLVSMLFCFKIFRASFHYPHWRSMTDFTLAIYVMYFILTPIDGGMISRVDQLIILLMIAGSAGSLFLRAIRDGEADEELELAESNAAWNEDLEAYEEYDDSSYGDTGRQDPHLDDEWRPYHA